MCQIPCASGPSDHFCLLTDTSPHDEVCSTLLQGERRRFPPLWTSPSSSKDEGPCFSSRTSWSSPYGLPWFSWQTSIETFP
ncbi:hypothetical protein AVEN_102072-1 [Araneus ventricosus]|uniref:Uncharacterized protein n=1 Tax=Araneus ventricosus TaxID=182803 RepID=A0A4Y2U8G3_ARAVE|nr:hypothetical protein AVEN_102072-1 [Araneus ventricosus]